MKQFWVLLIATSFALPNHATAQEVIPFAHFAEFKGPALFEQPPGAEIRPVAKDAKGQINGWYPIGGALIGAAAGGIVGVVLMMNTDAYLGPPAYVFTAPVGGALGFLAGLVVGAMVRP